MNDPVTYIGGIGYFVVLALLVVYIFVSDSRTQKTDDPSVSRHRARR
jgi:hypothetical protein